MPGIRLSVSSLGAARGGAFPRPPSQHAHSRGACRSLFGPVDHDELNRDIEAKLREISERDQTRWNFNFVAGTPLRGDYEWEGTAADAAPTFYQESVQVGKRRAVCAHVNPRTEAPNRENRAQGDAGRGAAVRPEPGCARGAAGRRKRKTSAQQTSTTSRITDFYGKRRKQGSLSPSSSLSSEQTPRKRLR